MASIKQFASASLFILAVLIVGGMVLSRIPTAALPSITWPAAQQAVASRMLIQSNWGEIGVVIDDALDHATAKHGADGAEALRMAQEGRCVQAFLECGYSWETLVDGVLGYFVCRLSDGRKAVVPFHADALAGGLVAHTGFPIRRNYEKWLAERDGCAPVDLLLLLTNPDLEKDYADD